MGDRTTSRNGHPQGPNQAGGLRLLLVEDHADTATSTALMLGLYGHEVRVAHDGLTALREAAAHGPDVVLLDIGLPGMNGWEVARRLQNPGGRKRPLLIAITGFGREQDRQKSAEAGIDVHLTKPVAPAVLKHILERFRQVLLGE